jgi:hypothetical protein
MYGAKARTHQYQYPCMRNRSCVVIITTSAKFCSFPVANVAMQDAYRIGPCWLRSTTRWALACWADRAETNVTKILGPTNVNMDHPRKLRRMPKLCRDRLLGWICYWYIYTLLLHRGGCWLNFSECLDLDFR